MYARRLSGENAATDAFAMFRVVTVGALADVAFTTKTSLKRGSEKIASDPLLETAKTLPVTEPIAVNAEPPLPTFAGLMANASVSLPV